MAQKGFSVAPAGGKFNTLVQNGTTKTLSRGKRPVIVKGQGTPAHKPTDLAKRAKRKTITQRVTLALIDVATKRGEPERVKAYWNTYYCQSSVVSSNNRLHGNYCGNRFCTLCAGIRKAEIINKYLPVVQTWQAPYLVTLTSKAVPLKWLKGRMNSTLRAFKIITDRHRKRAQRGKGKKLMGLRSLECNFNPIQRTYNVHLHLIVPDNETAELIIAEWLALWKERHAVKWAQNGRPVKQDKLKDLIEVVKYGSKIFTDPTMKSKAKRKASPYIYVAAFHNIIWAMEGHRVFDRFGFNLPASCPVGKKQIITEYELLKFDPQLNDWVSPETGELLTLYKPAPELMALLEGNMDRELE